MNLDFSDEQTQLRNLIERFIRENAPTSGGSTRRDSASLGRHLAELGLLALPFEPVHSPGHGAVELAVMMEALGGGLLGGAVLPSVLYAGGLLDRAGGAEHKADWLPRLIAGKARIAVAHIEHGTTSSAPVQTTAHRTAQGYLLNGHKTFVMADDADALLISARSDEHRDAAGSYALFIASPDAPGFVRHDYRLIDGSRACEIELTNVNIPASARLPRGHEAMTDATTVARFCACAEMLGIMTLLLNETLTHIRTRRQFGAPLSSFQSIRHRVVDLYILLEASRSLIYRAALLHGKAEVAWPREVAGVKAYVGDAALRVGHECIQFHGGMGVTDELVIGRAHKRNVLLSRIFGDGDALMEEYARG
jgi:alkylation response protein AidB-like acyl-CoA dehydrogenase